MSTRQVSVDGVVTYPPLTRHGVALSIGGGACSLLAFFDLLVGGASFWVRISVAVGGGILGWLAASRTKRG